MAINNRRMKGDLEKWSGKDTPNLRQLNFKQPSPSKWMNKFLARKKHTFIAVCFVHSISNSEQKKKKIVKILICLKSYIHARRVANRIRIPCIRTATTATATIKSNKRCKWTNGSRDACKTRSRRIKRKTDWLKTSSCVSRMFFSGTQ